MWRGLLKSISKGLTDENTCVESCLLLLVAEPEILGVRQAPFFLGINHQHSMRAGPGDVQLLLLGRSESEDLFAAYPEDFQIICDNILGTFGITFEGAELGSVQEETSADKESEKKVSPSTPAAARRISCLLCSRGGSVA